MNKQELIDKINRKKGFMSFSGETISKEGVLKLVSKLDEPQKVVVPKYIDGFIKYAKNEGMSLYIAMDNAQNPEECWIIKNEDTFARAWLDGYEVEKFYVVEVFGTTLCKAVSDNHVRYMMLDDKYVGLETYNYFVELTESEIKAVDERLWPFAKEVTE